MHLSTLHIPALGFFLAKLELLLVFPLVVYKLTMFILLDTGVKHFFFG